MLHTLSDRYHLLREELLRLQSAEVRDMPAIDRTLDALAAEYRHLKSEDGQHGNNPIECRHGEPSVLQVGADEDLPQR
ncbi:hypothetical protein [Rhizobacter sp. LjRoot28]|jgi:hypothetical protein|uniref:hypothetical protein n=1 Tax=Rhizobacter sp. LjRoot28 TaxID=3342309 RepID=UPI003ED142B9